MTKFSVPDMTCGHCKMTIEKAVLDADEGAELSFDLDKHELEVDSVLAGEELAGVIKAAGYTPAEIG